jgi:RNA polymerase sigma-70 factor (family 1)
MRDLSNLQEHVLVKRLQKGDAQAFTEIYNRYWEKLLAIGYFYTKDKSASEDIVHEVMMSLWERRHELEIYSLTAYLGTAIKFSVFKYIAKQQRRKQIDLTLQLPDRQVNIEQNIDARFLKEYLHGTKEQLHEKTKLVFDYSRNEHLTVKQIAAKMDLSPKAVEYHLTKALKAFRESLKKIKFFII